MLTFLVLIEIAVSLLLSLCILVQHRASGLSATFGGSGAVAIQRRGAEKVLYRITIILSIVFFALSLVHLIVAA
jgi:protein translocase SecG subunit